MALISLSKCTFGYNGNNLLNSVSIAFNDNEHVAIIGDNGSGKTTLLRLLAGDLLPDSGTANKNADVYMLNQINASDSKSGGEQQMFALMRAFESDADILLLDEPTNNLDPNAKQTFFNRLNAYPNGVVIVSHDRELLQQMDKIIELHNGQLKVYGGNYDFYLDQKRIESDSIYSKYTNAKKSITRLNNTLNIAQNTRQHHEFKQQKEINSSRRSRLEQNALKGKSIETEAKRRMIAIAFENRCQIFFTLHVFKSQADAQLIGRFYDSTKVFQSNFGRIVFFKSNKWMNDHNGHVMSGAVTHTLSQLCCDLFSELPFVPHIADLCKRSVNGLPDHSMSPGGLSILWKLFSIPSREKAVPPNSLQKRYMFVHGQTGATHEVDSEFVCALIHNRLLSELYQFIRLA